MKKYRSIMFVVVLAAILLPGCGASAVDSNTGVAGRPISVISREDGSGTRGAFIELFKIQEKGDGMVIDHTTVNAIIASSTGIVLNNVVGNPFAIGYVSIGSLNDAVKVVDIEGVAPTEENVKNGSYQVTRPFNIATKGTPGEATQDFIDYILSSDGQKIVEDNKYVAAVDAPKAYENHGVSGKVAIAGSSSVSPVMEKLIEAYGAVNPNVRIELQTNDSTTGLQAAISGTCNIAMASRDLTDAESAELAATAIAIDGIAIIVNKDNKVDNMTIDEVRQIYTGEKTTW